MWIRCQRPAQATTPVPLSTLPEGQEPPLAKLHPSVAAVIARLKSQGQQPGVDEARFVRGGKAELQVWLADKSAEAVAQLKQLGFEVLLDPKTSKLVIGRLPVEKLPALAELKMVRYVAPQTTLLQK